MKKTKIIIITDLVVATLFLTTIIFQKNIEDFMIKKRFQNNISEKNTDYKSLKFNNNLIINTTDDKKYDNKYEAEIQNRGNNNNYKIININVANNKGWLVVVYDPSTVHIMKSKAFKTPNNDGKENILVEAADDVMQTVWDSCMCKRE